MGIGTLKYAYKYNIYIFIYKNIACMYIQSGQIIATSHDRFPPNGGDCKGNGTPAISGKSRLVKYYFIWPDSMHIHIYVYATNINIYCQFD